MMMMIALPTYAADNEIFITQSGTTANIDLEQLGSSNIIGGLNAAAGSMTTLDIDGNAFTLDINQIGNTNKFLGDIWGDNVTAFFEFDGDSNTFTIQADPTNTYGIDNSNLNVDVTGSTNTFTLNQGTTALAATLDLDWVINGTGNTVVSNINYDGATNFMDIDGKTGNNMTFNVQQLSTQDNDWLKIISISNNTGSNTSSFCIIQNDQGSSTGC